MLIIENNPMRCPIDAEPLPGHWQRLSGRWLNRLCRGLHPALLASAMIWGGLSPTALALDSASIVRDTVGCQECTDWRVSGVCYWLRCTAAKCHIETSVRVSHNIPDVIISTYNGQAPWEDLDILGQASDGTLSAAGDAHSVTNFKNLQVIGNPAVIVYQRLWESTGNWCASQLQPFEPVYLSAWSEAYPGVSWNSNIAEQALGLIHPFKSVGHLGDLYPRTGWTVEPNDPKAAALTAARAAHIVTRERQPHLYNALGGECGDRCWPPGAYDPDDTTSAQFQRLHPHLESSSAPLGIDPNGHQGQYNTQQQYSWALWRPYSCCEKRGRFLYSMEF